LGKCNKGEECKFLHLPIHRIPVCAKFLKKQCQRGKRCAFHHCALETQKKCNSVDQGVSLHQSDSTLLGKNSFSPLAEQENGKKSTDLSVTKSSAKRQRKKQNKRKMKAKNNVEFSDNMSVCSDDSKHSQISLENKASSAHCSEDEEKESVKPSTVSHVVVSVDARGGQAPITTTSDGWTTINYQKNRRVIKKVDENKQQQHRALSELPPLPPSPSPRQSQDKNKLEKVESCPHCFSSNILDNEGSVLFPCMICKKLCGKLGNPIYMCFNGCKSPDDPRRVLGFCSTCCLK